VLRRKNQGIKDVEIISLVDTNQPVFPAGHSQRGEIPPARAGVRLSEESLFALKRRKEKYEGGE